MRSSRSSLGDSARLAATVLFGLSMSLGCVGDAPTVVMCVLGTTSCGDDCVDVSVNPAHCGSCGIACAAGESCVDGSCACIGEVCNDGCVDLSSHPDHCGDCDSPCPEGRFCAEGRCTAVCSGDLAACGGDCVNPETDRDHCGACDAPCPLGAQCNDGTCECRPGLVACGDRCVDLSSDVAHCGACDAPCGPSDACEDNSCTIACGGTPCAPGEAVFGRWLGAPNSDVQIANVVALPSGDTVVAGTFTGTLLVGDGLTHTGAGRSLFAVRLDATGRPEWARAFGVGGATQEAFDAAAEGERVWLVGSAQGTVDFDGMVLTGGGRDALVLLLAEDGMVTQAERFGGPGVQRAKAVASTGGGAVIVAGSFADRLVRDGTTLATSDSNVDTDGFVMSVDGASAVSWFAHLGDAGAEELQEVHEVSSLGGVVAAAGRVDGIAEWEEKALTHVAGADGVVATFDAALGTIVSTSQITGAGVDAIYGAEVSATGVWVAGEYNGTATLIGDDGMACPLGALTAVAGADDFVGQLAADGCPSRLTSIDGPGADRVTAIATAPNGDVALVGHFTTSISFGGVPILDSPTAQTGFVIALDSGGSLSWASQFGGALQGFKNAGIGIGQSRVVVAGAYDGTVFFAPTALASAASEDGFVATLAR